MSASSARYGFEIPESTRLALEIFDGARLHRSRSASASINTGSGDSAFVTPNYIRGAAVRAIKAGRTAPRAQRGAPARDHSQAPRRQRDRHRSRERSDGHARSHLVLYNVFRAYQGRGGEVIMGNGGSYFYANSLANESVPVQVQLRKERAFRLDPADVERRIGPETKILAITNPEAIRAGVRA